MNVDLAPLTVDQDQGDEVPEGDDFDDLEADEDDDLEDDEDEEGV
jgi:hypothetical protein